MSAAKTGSDALNPRERVVLCFAVQLNIHPLINALHLHDKDLDPKSFGSNSRSGSAQQSSHAMAIFFGMNLINTQ